MMLVLYLNVYHYNTVLCNHVVDYSLVRLKENLEPLVSYQCEQGHQAM